jgi:hypothetical protein
VGRTQEHAITVVTTIIFLVIALILNSGRKRRMRIIRARMTPQGLKHGMDHHLLLKKNPTLQPMISRTTHLGHEYYIYSLHLKCKGCKVILS